VKRLHNSYCVFYVKFFLRFGVCLQGTLWLGKKVCLDWQGVYVLLGRWFYWYSRISMKMFYFDSIWTGYNSWSINVIELGLDTYLGWKYIIFFLCQYLFYLFIVQFLNIHFYSVTHACPYRYVQEQNYSNIKKKTWQKDLFISSATS
jgi:hypothetical protein